MFIFAFLFIYLFIGRSTIIDMVVETLKRNKHLGSSSRKIFGTILKVDEGKIETNGPENK